ncbi:MAG: hypothetical protein J6S45_07025, partial [Firmicutes bacterium]|nr:hypothetical protein [Bacillota bacterium]
KTGPYLKFQEKLKEKLSAAEREYDDLKKSSQQYVEGLRCGENSQHFAELQNLKEKTELYSVDEMETLIWEVLKEDEGEKLHWEDRRSLVLEEQAKNNQALGKALEQKKAKQQKQAAEEALKRLEASLADLEAQVKAEAEKAPEREALARTILVEEENLKKYEELERLLEKERVMDQNLRTITKNIAIHTESLAQAEAMLKALEEENEGLEDAEVQYQKIVSDLDQCKRYMDQLGQLGRSLKRWKLDQRTLEQQKASYQAIKAEYGLKKAKYDTMEQAYFDEQAGMLAQQLKEGSPCPVCGSLDHPVPAVLTENAPEKEDLERQKQLVEQARNEVNRVSVEVGQKAGAVEMLKNQISMEAEDLLGTNETMEAISTALDEAWQKEDLRKKELTEAEGKQKQRAVRKAEVRKRIPELQQKQKEAAEAKAAAQQQAAALEAEQKAVKEQVEERRSTLTYDDQKQAMAHIRGLKQKKTSMDEALEGARTALEEQNRRIEGHRSTIAMLETQLMNTEETDLESLEENNRQLAEELRTMNHTLTVVSGRISENQRTLDHLLRQGKELEEVRQQVALWSGLSKTANGRMSGEKQKIMLETYVQMSYFDRILTKANRRLLVMSGGQYELMRRKEAKNFQSQSGLEMDVIDHYNGSIRSVKSLSGGESFQASLSLALGLSVEIQSSAGGIRLDAMFVDEGFGSLDEESLNQAIRALSDLSEGNRLVGIISHVAELKERIDKQIVVTKEKSGGSRVQILA